MISLGRKDIFNLKDHINNTQYGIDNHYFTLLKQISFTFINLRVNYISKLTNSFLQKNASRKTLTKIIHFKGE